MKKYNVAILGATGAVGTEFLKLIEERNFPFAELRLLASKRSAGKQIEFMGKTYTVQEATKDSFEGIDIALFAGGSVSKEFAPYAVKAGAVVIDNSSTFRMDPEVPLVVPEVNPEDILKHKGIIANPNCSTIIMVMALKPLYDLARINVLSFLPIRLFPVQVRRALTSSPTRPRLIARAVRWRHTFFRPQVCRSIIRLRLT